MGAPPIVHAVPELKARGFRTIGAVVLDVVEGGSTWARQDRLLRDRDKADF
jgi:hypothetical protein